MSDQFKVKDELFFKSSAEGDTRGTTISSAGIHGEGNDVVIDTYGGQLKLKNDYVLPLTLESNDITTSANNNLLSSGTYIHNSALNMIMMTAGNFIEMHGCYSPSTSSYGDNVQLRNGIAVNTANQLYVQSNGPTVLNAIAGLNVNTSSGINIKSESPINIDTPAPLTIKSGAPTTIQSSAAAPINIGVADPSGTNHGSSAEFKDTSAKLVSGNNSVSLGGTNDNVTTTSNTAINQIINSSQGPCFNNLYYNSATSSTASSLTADNVSIVAGRGNYNGGKITINGINASLAATVSNSATVMVAPAKTQLSFTMTGDANNSTMVGRANSFSFLAEPKDQNDNANASFGTIKGNLSVYNADINLISPTGTVGVSAGNYNVICPIGKVYHTATSAEEIWSSAKSVKVLNGGVTIEDNGTNSITANGADDNKVKLTVDPGSVLINLSSGAGKAFEVYNGSSTHSLLAAYPGTARMQAVDGRVQIDCDNSGITLWDHQVNTKQTISSAGVAVEVSAMTHSWDRILVGEVSSSFTAANEGGVVIAGGLHIRNTINQAVDPTFIYLDKDSTSAHTELNMSASRVVITASNMLSQSGQGGIRLVAIDKPIELVGSEIYTRNSVTSADPDDTTYQMMVVSDSSTSGKISKKPFAYRGNFTTVQQLTELDPPASEGDYGTFQSISTRAMIMYTNGNWKYYDGSGINSVLLRESSFPYCIATNGGTAGNICQDATAANGGNFIAYPYIPSISGTINNLSCVLVANGESTTDGFYIELGIGRLYEENGTLLVNYLAYGAVPNTTLSANGTTISVDLNTPVSVTAGDNLCLIFNVVLDNAYSAASRVYVASLMHQSTDVISGSFKGGLSAYDGTRNVSIGSMVSGNPPPVMCTTGSAAPLYPWIGIGYSY